MDQSQMEKTFGGPVVFGRARRSGKSGWLLRTTEKHLWCSLCSRTFANGIYRRVAGDQICPYADCGADVARDAREWSSVRRDHPNYPAAPWTAVQYPGGTATAPSTKSARHAN